VSYLWRHRQGHGLGSRRNDGERAVASRDEVARMNPHA
jgi:hypothetical protein